MDVLIVESGGFVRVEHLSPQGLINVPVSE